MNGRTMVLVGAVALLGIGLVMVVAEVLGAPPAEPRTVTAVSAQQIEPYTVITQDMVATGDALPAREASLRAAWQLDDVVGKMATDLVAPGELLTASNVRPIEDVRFVEDFSLEVVSFQASVDRLVGGHLRPGHVVNVYGFGQDPESNTPFTTLIEAKVWVVGVSSGGRPVSEATPQVDMASGELIATGAADDRPTTMLTVAVPPENAFHLIDALGAQGLSAWVTLAANQIAAPTATPLPVAELPTAIRPSEELGPTMTAIAGTAIATAPPTPPVGGMGGAAP
jgi:hypothetical protein